MQKSKILVVGGTGYIGKRIVKASLAQGHPTYVLMRREIGYDIEKLQMLLSFKDQGALLVEGSFSDHRSLVDAVKQVDVVICTMSEVQFRSRNILLQLKLVDAIKEAGNIKSLGWTLHEWDTHSNMERRRLRTRWLYEKPSKTLKSHFSKLFRGLFCGQPFPARLPPATKGPSVCLWRWES